MHEHLYLKLVFGVHRHPTATVDKNTGNHSTYNFLKVESPPKWIAVNKGLANACKFFIRFRIITFRRKNRQKLFS